MELKIALMELKSGANMGVEEVELELRDLELKTKMELMELTVFSMLLLKIITMVDDIRFSIIMLH